VRCPSCGALGAPDARFCDRCGAALGAARAAGPTTPSGDRGIVDAHDRRVVTALFADIVDYVRMVAEHDPEDVRVRIRTALQTMGGIIERFDGTREKFIGDAVFAVFGWPRAHGDDAMRAAVAAATIRAALRDPGPGAEPLEVRIGLATGEVVTTVRSDPARDDLALTGSAITTAARIQSLARPGEILLDAATVAAARGRIHTEDRGSVMLRGQSHPIVLHALEGDLGAAGKVLPRPSVTDGLVGRVAESGRLRALLDRAATTGVGGTMLVVGEAGIGKSRLLADLETEARERGFAWTWTDSTSYGQGEPYRFARILAQTLADEHGVDSGSFARSMLFTPDTDAGDVRRFGGAIAAIARDAAFSGWEAEARHTPNDPAAVTDTLLEVARRYVDRIVEVAGPRVLVIDDLHWIDPSSEGMVEVLVKRTAGLPLIVLAGTRPGPEPGWLEEPWVETIDLAGLSLDETAQLATQVARAALGSEDAQRIHERTAGNPLFVTETVRAFLDDGTLSLRDGRVTLSAATNTQLPVTLRAVLGARIDALQPDAREALGVASVVGMRFDRDSVEALLGPPIDPGTLERLANSGLIIAIDERHWRFGHPLIHDAAYAGVLTSRRRRLHARLADRLEAAADPLSLALLAMHRAASGDAERAIPLLEVAAATALAMGAAAESAGFLRAAADLARDPEEAEAYRSRADALSAVTA
jgi:class 3 adenylate cyclase